MTRLLEESGDLTSNVVVALGDEEYQVTGKVYTMTSVFPSTVHLDILLSFESNR